MTNADLQDLELISRIVLSSPHPLKEQTTLAVGAAPLYEAHIETDQELRVLTRWAKTKGLPLYPIGAGSNLLCSDDELHGILVRIKDCAVTWDAPVVKNAPTIVTAGAGLIWDDLVEQSVERSLSGLECLSGIPGCVGAAPIQNIGAYGQSLSDTCVGVKVYDTLTDELDWWNPERCHWKYRHSIFKEHPRRFIILKVRFSLHKDGLPNVSYPQVNALFLETLPTLSEVRQAVLKLRKSKSMVYDQSDPNHRSAGSFFLNPVLSPQGLRALEQRTQKLGLADPPRWSEGLGYKIPAGWLIENSGCPKGYGEGAVGLSDQHCLALINRGTARAIEVIEFARHIQNRVKQTMGIWLTPEVNLWGFKGTPLDEYSHDLEPIDTWQNHPPKLALASCRTLPPWERDDALLISELRRRGIEVSCPSWDDPVVEWSQYDLVIPRTTWNYQESPDRFRQWLSHIEQVSTLANQADVIRWNLNKSYLKDLEAYQALTPPTYWFEQVTNSALAPSAEELYAICQERGWSKAFLKPTIAANAWGTIRFSIDQAEELDVASAHLSNLLTQRGFILQPYYETVETDGEFSMIFFGGHFSHGVQKIPKSGDYRVQDDHGATDRPWAPPSTWIEQAQALLKALPYSFLYARVDCLRAHNQKPHLIELEVIEPSLFFRHDPQAPARFAQVISTHLETILKNESVAQV